MKALIALLLLLGVFWVGKQLWLVYLNVQKERPSAEAGSASAPASASSSLPGLPPTLEASLAAAESGGAARLGEWLRTHRVHVKDPRLAAIELDYVVLISRQDPAEARRIFQSVQNRTPTFSPIHERVKRLEPSFQ